MQPDSTSVLTTLYWVSPGKAGELQMVDCHGQPIAGHPDPPLAQAMATLAAGQAPVRVTVRNETNADLILDVWPHPGLEGTAIAIEARLGDRILSQPLETLVNHVAHDVRNFAFTMGLQAELGMRRTKAHPEASGHFEAVVRQIDNLKVYLDKLLLFGRPAALEPKTTEVVPFVRELVHTFQFSWGRAESPLSISIEGEPALGQAIWDTRLLGAAMRALLDNASRSAEPPPSVVVRLRSVGPRVEIAVSDQGNGIPAATLDKLTMPMVVRRPGGAGLGLAIARKMVAAHGGELAIRSSPDGTTVVLTLPREAKAD